MEYDCLCCKIIKAERAYGFLELKTVEVEKEGIEGVSGKKKARIL